MNAISKGVVSFINLVPIRNVKDTWILLTPLQKAAVLAALLIIAACWVKVVCTLHRMVSTQSPNPTLDRYTQGIFAKSILVRGVFIDDWGRCFDGNFVLVEDKWNGDGKVTYPDGRRQEGTFKNGELELTI